MQSLDVLAVIRTPLEQYPPSLNQVALLAEDGLKVGVVDCWRADFAPHIFRGPQPVERLRPCKGASLKEGLPSIAVRVWRTLAFRRCVLRVINQRRPKVVIAYDPNGMAAVRPLWHREHLPKLVWHFHELCFQARKEAGFLGRRAIDFAYRHANRADLVICPDQGRGEILTETAGLTRAPMVVMNCPRRMENVPQDGLSARLAERGMAGLRTVYFHGWMGPNRGLEAIVQSMRWWPEDSIFTLVGPAAEAYRTSLLHIASRVGVQSRIVFLGSVPYSQVLSLAAGATVGCSLVTGEGDPNWIHSAGAINKRFEYMAVGLAQVTNNGMGVSEIVDKNQCGVSVDPNSPEAVGQAVRQLLADEARRQMFSRGARSAHLRLYNYETQFAELGRWIRTACQVQPRLASAETA